MHDEQFLTTEEVMEYLQVNLRTVYRLIKAGRIPAVRIGRQWRFHKKDIDVWLHENRSSVRSVPPRPASTRRSRVLVVDDEQIVRDLLQVTLSSADYDVDAAPDGARAIQMLHAAPYDLLITDVRMPLVSGPEFAKRMRYTNAPKLLFMSGASSEPLTQLIRNGAGFIRKPFRKNELLKAVAQLLPAHDRS